jgi:hypothetical protein
MYNRILGEGRQQEIHLHREQQLEEPIQEELVKYIHHAEVVVHHSRWRDMIPPSGYQNSKEKHRRTRRSTYLSVRRPGNPNKSWTKTLNLHI